MEPKTNGQGRGLKPFTAGDPRINRKGRPKGFDEFRKLAQGIADEKVTLSSGNKISVIEAILRSWAKSREPVLQKAFVEYCYGKPPDRLEVNELTPNKTLILNYGHERPRARLPQCGGERAESTTVQTVRAFRRLRAQTRPVD